MDFKKIVKKGKIRFDASGLTAEEEIHIRREVIGNQTKTSLKAIANPSFDIKTVSSKNCENLIGKVEIPLGVVGPLKINGDFAKGDFYIPLATTEGALVASTNRGCKAITESGGTSVFIEKLGITRAPVFITRNIKEARKLLEWINTHFKDICRIAGKTDEHLKLLSITPYIAGRNVFLRFSFDTGDAMGMNMATLACEIIAKDYIEKEFGAKCLSLSGNVCTDKKPAWINKIEGRGFSVTSDVVIPKATVKNVLKSTAGKVEEVYKRKIIIGSSVSGSMGFNAHHANIVAAIFLATGQDPAHVVEGSQGSTFVEKLTDGDLYFSVASPSLVVGSIGGGTQLATQKEALSILGVSGGGSPPGINSKKLAEIISSTILAGEVSLLSALASGDLVKAHEKLGRGKNV
jgi:hydroxymethylglutaryl-CoA reductase (NADPH)